MLDFGLLHELEVEDGTEVQRVCDAERIVVSGGHKRQTCAAWRARSDLPKPAFPMMDASSKTLGCSMNGIAGETFMVTPETRTWERETAAPATD